jgi:hypothetical protein
MQLLTLAVRWVGVLLVAAACAGSVWARGVERLTKRAHEKQPPGAALREVLAGLGFGDDFFAGFTDGQAIDPAEREKLLTLLSRLPQIAKPTLEGAAQHPSTLRRLRLNSPSSRGDVYHLRVGRVSRVQREELPDDLKARFGFTHYFRCQAVLVGEPCEIYTLAVPAAWKLNRTIDEECSAWAMFVKELPKPAIEAPREDAEADDEDRPDRPNTAGDDAAPLLFVSERVAWHPTTLLGFLSVDYGLFDGVRDRTPLTEREVFYQLLASAGRMTDEYLQTQVDRLIRADRASLDRLVRNRDLPSKMRADAQRGWQRIQEGASDVAPLFDDPASQRGRFSVFQGEATRAVEVHVDDPDVAKRFGIDHYYEIDFVTPDSENKPLVCCVTRIPPNLPLGNEIHEQVQVAGFFLKSAECASRSANPSSSGEAATVREKEAKQITPLLVATTVTVLTPVRFQVPTQSLQLAAGLLLVFAGFGSAMWYVQSSDRRVAAAAAIQQNSLPETIGPNETSSGTA